MPRRTEKRRLHTKFFFLGGGGRGANKVHCGKCGGVYTSIFLEIFSKLLF